MFFAVLAAAGALFVGLWLPDTPVASRTMAVAATFRVSGPGVTLARRATDPTAFAPGLAVAAHLGFRCVRVVQNVSIVSAAIYVE